MPKRHLIVCLLLLFLAGSMGATPEATNPPPKVYGYVMWNPEYLCIAAKVEDPALIGTNFEPMSQPWEDDAIQIDLDLGWRGRLRPDPKTFRLVISAAGGFSALIGTEDGRWRPNPRWMAGLKFDVLQEGTLNHAKDTDQGFIVEIAIPWKFLGGKPREGAVMGFNFVCYLRGENETFVSWSPHVESKDDLDNPSKWGSLRFRQAMVPMAAEHDQLICPLTMLAPLVDGSLTAGEWMTASTFQITKPQPALPSQPTGPDSSFFPLIMATYYYWFQGDPRQAASLPPVRRPDGSIAITDQPKEGAGPWFSWSRVGWHKEQLEGMERAGIDVILPVYRGDQDSHRTWSRQGLSYLVQALKEMKADGRSYPLVGMFLEASCLEELSEEVDLSSPAAKQMAYGMIREFFTLVPREFQAQVGMPHDHGNLRPRLVVVGEAPRIPVWRPELIRYCNQAFERDFPGACLVWLGDSSWQDKLGEDFSGYCSIGKGGGFHYNTEGSIRVASLNPGYDDTDLASGQSQIRSRSAGRAYRGDWLKALSVRPDYVIIDGWNSYHTASEIAPSRQYGFEYVDLTRLHASRLANQATSEIQLRQETLPRVLRPGTNYRIEVLVKNAATSDLTTRRGGVIRYHLINPETNSEIRSGIALNRFALLAGETKPLALAITTKDKEGNPLKPGRYLVRLEILKSSMPVFQSHWFLRRLAIVPFEITVGEPQPAATVLSTTLPVSLQTGKRYQVLVALRNDGPQPWKSGKVKLSYHWYRCSDDPSGEDHPSIAVVERAGLQSKLPKTVAPGEIVLVKAAVETKTKSGEPLPPWEPDQPWHYRLAWDLIDHKGQWLSPEEAKPYQEVVQVRADDPGVRFVDSATPHTMQAGQSYRVKVMLANSGTDPWEREDCRLSYHWYFWDGVEALWQGEESPLYRRVPAGDSVMIQAQIVAPPYGGPYTLVWDLWREGKGFASTGPSFRSRETLSVPVSIVGGPFQPIDLAEHLETGNLNVIAATTTEFRPVGDFDGRGHSYPAEFLPPDLSSPTVLAYPCGYYAPATSTGFSSCRKITFAFPKKIQGRTQALACTGQVVKLPAIKAVRLHLLGAATGPRASDDLVVTYADNTSDRLALTMSHWLEPPTHGEEIGFTVGHLHSLEGNDWMRRGYLYHYALDLKADREVTSIRLPEQSDMKILALTLETAQSHNALPPK